MNRNSLRTLDKSQTVPISPNQGGLINLSYHTFLGISRRFFKVKLKTMKVGTQKYPVVGYVFVKQYGTLPLVDIPQMSDERWQELARAHPVPKGAAV